MKAAVYSGGGKPLTIESLPDPEPGPGELLLKVHRCGICGTDLTMTKGGQWDFPAGSVPGHEFAGEVVAVGTAVSRFKVGDKITSLPSTGCGQITCSACKVGNLTLCGDAPGLMGGYGEYIKVPEDIAVKLPSVLTLTDGALVEPLAVGLYGVRQATIRPGDNVLVMGGGTVALSTIYWARPMLLFSMATMRYPRSSKHLGVRRKLSTSVWARKTCCKRRLCTRSCLARWSPWGSAHRPTIWCPHWQASRQ